jgi:hypothetical protein
MMYGWSWWWLWMVFLLVWMIPTGYGWGYRGWGPPYPRFVQRRRGPPIADADSPTPHHLSWGWGGDFVWTMFLIGMMWLLVAFAFPLWQR